jgi:hypothetical protein
MVAHCVLGDTRFAAEFQRHQQRGAQVQAASTLFFVYFCFFHACLCSRYVNISSCNYIVDLDGPWQAEEHFVLRPDFTVIASLPFMRASATPALLRWLWMPPGVMGGTVNDPYVLLERNGNSSSK